MPVVSMKEIADRALAERYGVPAINVFNDLTLEGACWPPPSSERSPLIVQTSVKTVRSIGSAVLIDMWRAMTAGVEVPVSLHLDHCPDRAVITDCLQRGWNSVLFDASAMPVEENQRQTVEVVAEARRYGAHVEGEIEAITGVEDDHGSDEESARQSLEVVDRRSSRRPGSTCSPRRSATPTACTRGPRSSTDSGSATSSSAPGSRSPCTAAPG